MKTTTAKPPSWQRRSPAGFTLVEAMIAVGVFLGIFVGVMVGLQTFGLRVYALAATKLSATADARKSLNSLRDEIRSAKIVYVGTFTNHAFSRIPDGLPQTGNALEIYFGGTNNTIGTTPVIYYQSASDSANALYRVNSNEVSLAANYLTNYNVFTAEDYQTNILTSYDNNPVIRVTMQFYQWEYPIGFVGTNALNAYNFYRLQTRVSRRTKE